MEQGVRVEWPAYLARRKFLLKPAVALVPDRLLKMARLKTRSGNTMPHHTCCRGAVQGNWQSEDRTCWGPAFWVKLALQLLWEGSTVWLLHMEPPRFHLQWSPEPCCRILRIFQAHPALLNDLPNRGQVASGGTKHSGKTWVLYQWQIWSLLNLYYWSLKVLTISQLLTWEAWAL